jgi:hypothetical protein
VIGKSFILFIIDIVKKMLVPIYTCITTILSRLHIENIMLAMFSLGLFRSLYTAQNAIQ